MSTKQLRIKRYLLARLFTTFPGGAAGVGLLLLRSAAGGATVMQGLQYLTASMPLTPPHITVLSVAAVLIGLMLLLGVMTPVAGAVTALGIGGNYLSWFPAPPGGSGDEELVVVFSEMISAAIILLGPGNLSVDARIFGRREIVITHVPRLSK